MSGPSLNSPNAVSRLPLAKPPPKPLCQLLPKLAELRGLGGRVLKKFQAKVQLEKAGSTPSSPWQCQQSPQRCHTRCPAPGMGTAMLTAGLKLPSSVFHMDPCCQSQGKAGKAARSWVWLQLQQDPESSRAGGGCWIPAPGISAIEVMGLSRLGFSSAGLVPCSEETEHPELKSVYKNQQFKNWRDEISPNKKKASSDHSRVSWDGVT